MGYLGGILLSLVTALVAVVLARYVAVLLARSAPNSPRPPTCHRRCRPDFLVLDARHDLPSRSSARVCREE